jgi:hypothetical protein
LPGLILDVMLVNSLAGTREQLQTLDASGGP